MGHRDRAMFLAYAGDIAHAEAVALEPVGIGIERNPKKDERQCASKIRRERTSGLGKDVPCAPAIEFKNDVVAHCGYAMDLADRSAGQSRAEINFEVTGLQHPGDGIGTHDIAAKLKGLADGAVFGSTTADDHDLRQRLRELRQ